MEWYENVHAEHTSSGDNIYIMTLACKSVNLPIAYYLCQTDGYPPLIDIAQANPILLKTTTIIIIIKIIIFFLFVLLLRLHIIRLLFVSLNSM